MTPATPFAQLDHLVVAAASLDEGVRWCEHTLGITPGPGGEHPLMGTHNRLFSVASPAFPNAYLEIIAVQPGAPCTRPDKARRWFDLDDRELQAQLAATGPRLIHVVANTRQAGSAARALARQGLDRGPLLAASRMTPQGLLSWKITVREDGQRLFYGVLPTLIEWGDVHPATAMPASGISLQSVQVSHPRPQALQTAYDAIGLTDISLSPGSPSLRAVLNTPRGAVTLDSQGL